MKISLFRNKKDGYQTIVNEDFNDFISRIAKDSHEKYITKFREAIPYIKDKESWKFYDRIPRVCPMSEYIKNMDDECNFRTYNGISVLTIEGLNNVLEIEKVKRQVSIFPQVLCALMGADGMSVSVWTLATLPDGTLPNDENLAKLFCAQAYAKSVRCLQPSLEFKISLEEPTLDRKILLTVDDKPFINQYPTPFLIEQPTEDSIKKIINIGDPQNHLERIKPSAEAYVTFTTLFNAACARAHDSLPEWRHGHEPQEIITHIAQECASCGLPEEEVATRLIWRFKEEMESDIRGTVNNIYKEFKGISYRSALTKHQRIAFRLREFLSRRFEIRYNEVLAITEYRPRMSLQFMFKELDRRELNTIHHEACIEGIDPTFSEVEQLVHSNYTPIYNPIQEYLDELPTWDGKDRIGELAAMVPNNNPYWNRLFSRWFISMVAHWMNCDTTHANQTAPILIGAQGYRKSTFCRLILPPELQMFFTDSINFSSNVEAERCLSRFLLVNIDEFDQLNEKQFAFVKHLFQKPVTNRRRMYSDTIGTQRRYASFIGTSNHDEILRDPTGNRRYICVEVTEPIHINKSIDYPQLYAQAKHLIMHGERYYLNDEDEALLKETNRKFEMETPLEQLFLTAFSKPNDDGEWLTTTEIMATLKKLPTFNKQKDLNPIKLGRTLIKLKINKERKSQGYVYFVKRNN